MNAICKWCAQTFAADDNRACDGVCPACLQIAKNPKTVAEMAIRANVFLKKHLAWHEAQPPLGARAGIPIPDHPNFKRGHR